MKGSVLLFVIVICLSYVLMDKNEDLSTLEAIPAKDKRAEIRKAAYNQVVKDMKDEGTVIVSY